MTAHLKNHVSRFASAIVLAGALAACSHNANVDLARQSGDTKAARSEGGSSLAGLADQLAAQGDHNAAIPLYRQAIRRSIIGGGPKIGLAKSLIAVGRYEEAVYVLKKGDNDNPEGLRLLGNAQLVLGRPELAVSAFREAVRRGSDPRAYGGLGVALDALGRHGEAVDAYDDGLALDPGHLDLRTNKGLSLALHGQSAAGVSLLEGVVRDPASGPQHRLNLALAYVMLGDDARASRMASIDLGAGEAAHMLAYFRSLKMAEPSHRMAGVIWGGSQPAKNKEQPGNRVFDEEPAGVEQAVARAVEEEVVEVEPEVIELAEPEPTVEEQYPEIPPLLEPEGWAVQLAAYRTAEQIIAGWKLLSVKYADVIGHLEPRRSEVDFGDREEKPSGFFYRLNAGPLSGFDEAKAVCEALKARGAACWIRPPEPSEGRLPKDIRISKGKPEDAPEEDTPAEDTVAEAEAPAATDKKPERATAAVAAAIPSPSQPKARWQLIGTEGDDGGDDAEQPAADDAQPADGAEQPDAGADEPAEDEPSN